MALPLNSQDVVARIEQWLEACFNAKLSTNRADYYVGTTADADIRVFTDHRVPRSGNPHAIWQPLSPDVAKAAEAMLRESGMIGGLFPDDPAPHALYCFLTTARTSPPRGTKSPDTGQRAAGEK